MGSIWGRGEDFKELAEVVKVDGTWCVRSDTGEVLMRGWRLALESWLRAAGWTKVEEH